MPEGLKVFLKDCFTTEGRMNRRRYFFYPIWFGILIFIPLVILIYISEFFAILTLPFYILIAYVSIIAHIKRWRDLWKSGWMTLLLFIPLVWLFFQLYLIFIKWDIWTNDFWPDRLQESTLTQENVDKNIVL